MYPDIFWASGYDSFLNDLTYRHMYYSNHENYKYPVTKMDWQEEHYHVEKFLINEIYCKVPKFSDIRKVSFDHPKNLYNQVLL